METARRSTPDFTDKTGYKNSALVHMDPDALMKTLVEMKTGKTTFHKEAGFQIDRREILDPPPPVPDWLKEEQKKWRRFKLIATDKEQMEELNAVLVNSNFTLRDLALIITCLRIQPDFSLEDFTAKAGCCEPFASADP